MRAFVVLLLGLAACGDNGGPPAEPTTTTTTTTSTSSSTESAIDCSAINSCIQHPDVCPAPCTCDASAPADAICATVEAGDFLLRCVDGVGLAGACPYGCESAFTGEQAYCRPPGEECPAGTSCDDMPDGCGTCACQQGPDGCNGMCCINKVVLGGCTPDNVRVAKGFCAFGCGMWGECCLDKLCE
jgi:hypothetical protein